MPGEIKDLIKNESSVYIPSVIDSVLSAYGISLKKRFGQNFLINRRIAEFIIGLINPDSSDRVVEIGPGLGALTIPLARRVKEIVAIEIDRGLYRILKAILNELKIHNVNLINRDFFKLDEGEKDLINNCEKLISNFPYSSGQRIIVEILENYKNIRCITGTLQKEVAERFCAGPGSKNYGFISVWVQFLSHVKIQKKELKPGNFYPAPDVKSSIVSLTPVKRNYNNYAWFKDFLRCAFKNRRKSLINNIVTCFKIKEIKRELLENFIKERFRDLKVRAENLRLEDFLSLADIIDII